MNLTTWAWLILPLGVCRATQIALHDRIFEKPRSWLLSKLNPNGLPMTDPERPYLSYLLECPWCLSVWIGFAAVALVLWDATRAGALAVLAALALSLAAVVLDRMVDRWFPDQPHSSGVTIEGDLHVHSPPEQAPPAVAAAFEELTGDSSTGAT